MPSSSHSNMVKIMDIIIKLDPQRILDIGPGFGKYGVLCREYLELWDGREDYNNWKTTIDAAEAFEDYITDLHKFIYNNIFIGNAFDLIENLNHYDLILLVDVLEHFEKDEGRSFIKKCLNKADSVLISIPRDFIEQEDSFGNEHERHKCVWTGGDLKKLGYNYFISTYVSYIILVSNNKEIVSDNFMGLRNRLYQNGTFLLILTSISRLARKFGYNKNKK